MATAALLGPDDPPPFALLREHGEGPLVLACDHAQKRVPASLGRLGLAPEQLDDHIGWDPGALAVARCLSELLDAPLVASGYSRLVIDCNRHPGVPSSIPERSGGVEVPGNQGLSDEAQRARAEACFWPYHRALEALLDRRAAEGRPTAFVSIHSFTPVLLGEIRPWDVAILHRDGRPLAQRLLAGLRADGDLVVGDNQPYQVTDAGDFSIPVHGEARGLHTALIEMRNDHVRPAQCAARMAERLARHLREALGELRG